MAGVTLVGPLEAVVGPMPCQRCRIPLVWGVRTHEFRERSGPGYVRRRGLYEADTQAEHRCEAWRLS